MTSRLDTTRARRDEAGFSLIELIIVLLILGILVGMLVVTSRGNDQRARQQAMQTVSNEVFKAAVAFSSDFPRVGGNDPLINFTQRTNLRRSLSPTGAPMPTAESKERDLGFFTKAGQPYFRAAPASPYNSGQIRVIRAGTCPATGQVGYVYVCRAGNGVRVTGWGRAKSGAALRVFDEIGGI